MYKLHIFQNQSVEFKTDFNFSHLNSLGLSVFVFLQKSLTNTEKLTYYLDEAELNRYQQFYYAKDKNNFLIGRFCVKTVVHHLFHIPIRDIQIYQKDIHSKPEVRGLNKPFFFSITHTADVVAIAFSSESPTGIDIESISSVKAFDLVVNSYFTQNEANKIKSAVSPEKTFKQFWTRKEAVVKLLGGQLLDQIKSFDVAESEFIFDEPLYSEQPENIYLYCFEHENEVTGSIAAESQHIKPEFYFINQAQIDKWTI